MIFMLVFGLGLGGNMQPLVLAVQNAVPPQDMGVATSSATFFRQMGGTLGHGGVPVGPVLHGRRQDHRGLPGDRADPGLPGRAARPGGAGRPGQRAGRWSLLKGGGNAGAAGRTGRHVVPAATWTRGWPGRSWRASPSSIDLVFLSAAAVMVVAFVLVLFMKEIPLRTSSGIQERAAEDAAARTATADEAVETIEGTPGTVAATPESSGDEPPTPTKVPTRTS